MFEYSLDQIAQIQALRGAGQFAAAYRLAAELADGGEGVDPAVIL